MYEPDPIFRSKDFAIALLAIYVSMTLAGFAAEFGPMGLATALASVVVAAGLLFWFATATKRGRGIESPVYFLAVIAFPVILVTLFVGLLILLPQEWLAAPFWMLFVAFSVGFNPPGGGPDAPLISYVWYWVPNMLLPGFVALIARSTLGALRGR